jgi:imidazolonepropionase-like amidohydrolase
VNRLLCLCVVCVLGACASAGANPVLHEPDGITALVGAVVWDGTGAPPIADAVVVMEKGTIAGVGPREGTPIPEGATVVDVSGRYIVPGLIDPHIHFFQSAGLYTRPDIVDLRATRPYEDDARQIRDALDATFRRYLVSGVTAVVDVGGPLWNFEVRERANATLLAPRVAASGPLISTVDRPQLDLGDPPIIRAESPEHARELVRQQLDLGTDFIKIWFILPASKDPNENIDLIRATIDEAHAGGVRVFVHATELETARVALQEGTDVLVHSVVDEPVDEAFVAQIAADGALLTTTLVVFEGYAEVLGQAVDLMDVERRYGDPVVMRSWGEMAAVGEDVLPPDKAAARVERLNQRMPTAQANLKTLWDAGIPVSAGTDAGNIGTLHGPSIHRELELMVQAGLTPEQVLTAVTRNAAMVFDADPQMGTLEPGKLADLLVLDADPLADVAHLQQLRYVVKGGAVIDAARLLPPNPADVVQRQVDAYNARDIDAFLSFYAEDVELMRHPSGEVFAQGLEQMRETYTAMFEASPELVCTIMNRTVSNGYVVDHELVTGMRGGPPVRAAAIYEVEGDLIQRVWFLPKE